ncbi:Uncharacterized protein APZ42_022500 [Daphnia magna]|uniref:Uncharacterized protein n=1 Tax=Daphnia magna TaxID=35525 RepID=A0A164VJX2_9CRUS|nr:Uncharacterized protein APZ42_022500 [Daphnia magna]
MTKPDSFVISGLASTEIACVISTLLMSCGFTWNLASQNCARCAVMATGPFL